MVQSGLSGEPIDCLYGQGCSLEDSFEAYIGPGAYFKLKHPRDIELCLKFTIFPILCGIYFATSTCNAFVPGSVIGILISDI